MTPNFSGLVSTENVWFWFKELTFQSWERKGDILYLNVLVFLQWQTILDCIIHNTEDWKLFGFISSLFPTAISWNCFSGVKHITEQLAAIALLKLPNVLKELGGRSTLFWRISTWYHFPNDVHDLKKEINWTFILFFYLMSNVKCIWKVKWCNVRNI